MLIGADAGPDDPSALGERERRRPVLVVDAADEAWPDLPAVDGVLAFFLPPNREKSDTILRGRCGMYD